MRAQLWGTRGSLARSGPATIRYGGDTACVAIESTTGDQLVLDAGSGILALGESLNDPPARIDILLSHLHMDHIQGLGFFTPLYSPDVMVHIWGPASATEDLRTRLSRYMSPPLFPVRLRDLEAVELHDLPRGDLEIGSIKIKTDSVSHPGHTYGFRLEENGGVLAYMSDHELGLGAAGFLGDPQWTSGYCIAEGADLLIHDAQYTPEEYAERIGWGHSTFDQAVQFAEMAQVGKMVTFHHDPSHSDAFLDSVTASLHSDSVEIAGGMVGAQFEIGA